MKTTFFPISDPIWTYILTLKCSNMEFLKLNFNFQSFRKREAILLSIMWLKDWLSKVKTSKIITVCYFWPKMGKNVVLISFRFPSSNGGLQFPIRYFYNHYFLLLNVFLIQFLKPIDNATFFVFFVTLDLIWPKFFPKNHTQCPFFLIFNEIC